jgi:transposase
MKKKSPQQLDREARLRAELIVKVRSGVMTASEAAKQLGVSRKTYYQWEKRGLQGMLNALNRRSGGRPAIPLDKEKEQLSQEVEKLRKQIVLLEQGRKIREILDPNVTGASHSNTGSGDKKKE